MKKTVIWIIIIILIIGFTLFLFAKKGNGIAQYKDLIRVTAPLPNSRISSPLTIKGEARGNWYFEASFPVKLLDGNGNQIAIIPAQAQGEWMTRDYVPFEITLIFNQPNAPTGTLVLEKDNPSGLPEHADEFRIPVRFR